MTETEDKRHTTGIPREEIVLERIWNRWIRYQNTYTETTDELVILELKRMSWVTDQYVTRTRNVVEVQSIRVHKVSIRTDI